MNEKININTRIDVLIKYLTNVEKINISINDISVNEDNEYPVLLYNNKKYYILTEDETFELANKIVKNNINKYIEFDTEKISKTIKQFIDYDDLTEYIIAIKGINDILQCKEIHYEELNDKGFNICVF